MLEHENQEPDSTAQTIRQAVRFLRVLWHRRIVVMGTLALCGILGGFYATATQIYEAEAQLLIVDTSRENNTTSMTGSHSDIAAMATYENLVSSPLVLQLAATLLEAPVRAFLAAKIQKYSLKILQKLNVRGVRQTNLLEPVSAHHTRKHLLPWLQQSFKLMQPLWMSHTEVLRTNCYLLQNEKDEVTRKLK